MTPDELVEKARQAYALNAPYLDRDPLAAAIAVLTPLLRNVVLEEAAKVCERRYMGDNNREDMEARRCAAAIRALKEDKA